MLKHTVSLFAVVALSACAVPVDVNEEAGDQEPTAEAEEAVTGTACTNMSADDTTALSNMNSIRTALGMNAINCNDKLQTAARAHSKYIGYNNLSFDHYEVDSTKPYYYAYAPGDRMKKAGFTTNQSGEDGGSEGDPAKIINGDFSWMNSVYHRIPFVTYQTASFGFGNYVSGTTKKDATMDFGGGGASPATTALAIWPKNGATGIYTTFHCAAESPKPIANCGPLGAVASITGGGTIVITSHEFRQGSSTGTLLARTLLTSGNDPNHFIPATQAYLIPSAALATSTTYFVKMVGTVSGTSFTKTWTFTTGTT